MPRKRIRPKTKEEEGAHSADEGGAKSPKARTRAKIEDEEHLADEAGAKSPEVLAAGFEREPSPGEEMEGMEGLSEYERQRQQNIRRNQMVMEKLGIFEAKAKLNKVVEARAAQEEKERKVRRAQKEAARKEAFAHFTPRRSGRLSGAADSPDGGVGGAVPAALAMPPLYAPELQPSRLGPEPVSMAGGDANGANRLHRTMVSLAASAAGGGGGAAAVGAKGGSSCSGGSSRSGIGGTSSSGGGLVTARECAARLSRLSVADNDVRKVVKERAYSLAWHPSPEKLLIACGDKAGHVGFWIVDGLPSDSIDGGGGGGGGDGGGSSGGDDDPDQFMFRPHTGAVSRLQYAPSDPNRLFSTSYDGTVRALDVNRGEFFQMYATDEDDGTYLTYSDFAAGGNVMYVSDDAGAVSALDFRLAGALVWRHTLHNKKVNTVQINPADGNVMLTASLDRTMRQWDLRTFGGGGGGSAKGKAAKGKAPLALAEAPHKQSINSAHFCPTGEWLATVCHDDWVHLFHNFAAASGGAQKPHHSLVHDNHTGRWLTKFQVSWDPKAADVYVVGSMARAPNSVVEVFAAAETKASAPIARLRGDVMASIQSVNVFHPARDVVAGVNSSGRVHIFR